MELNLSTKQAQALVLAIELARSTPDDEERRLLLKTVGGAAALDDLRALILAAK